MAFIFQLVAHHQVIAANQIDGVPLLMATGKKRFTSFLNADQIRCFEATVIDGMAMENFSTLTLTDGTEYFVEDVDMKGVWAQLAKKGLVAL